MDNKIAANSFRRVDLIGRLADSEAWDLIVIGGGATGLGVALDGISRGYKTLLLEKADYAKGTSSRSTKLVHGGVRYLAQGDVRLVREALHERGLLLLNAPHLVRTQTFVIPAYNWWEVVKYAIGLKLYDLLAGKRAMGASGYMGKKQVVNQLINVQQEELRGGVVYCDGQFDDARLAINLAQTAVESGGIVLNYIEVREILKDAQGAVAGVVAVDVETGVGYELRAKAVINATGVFVDDVRQMDDPGSAPIVRPSQGIHLVVDKTFLPGKNALVIPKTTDGRVLFAVPWHNRVVLGTTDTLVAQPSPEPQALEEEVDFILDTAAKYLVKAPKRKDVLSVFAGLRPLAVSSGRGRATKDISRRHQILVSKAGLITITGGKWTTYRRMAEDVVDRAIALGKLPASQSQTAHLAIHGAQLITDTSSHLYVYGSDRPALEQLMADHPDLGEKLDDALEFTKAEVVWAARFEMARTVEDVLARRVRVLFLDAAAAIRIAPLVAKLLAQELGRDAKWEEAQIAAFRQLAQHYLL
ncbi:glycerol-3-phosphate dehydrogenase/oxidase [Hymenobacter antarcticus]|uniref:Glycerol-3-phosphate dehydrogenase/oxidase n=1 Tax=Hymenobacter antarcticus TaxID=486270 RepID=A0ABP7R5C0_9BACT